MSDTDGYHLGEIAEIYEGSGPGTISSGTGDEGGVSYGTYQLSTARGVLNEYLKQSAYADNFKGLVPNTSTFNAEWRRLAATDNGFSKDQWQFIKQTHYAPELAALKASGLDLYERGPAVQEAIWSTAVQYGKLSKPIFEDGLEAKFGNTYELSKLTDKDIVVAVQDYKVKHVEQLFTSSPRDWPGLRARAENEKADLIALAEGRPLPERSRDSSYAHQSVLIHGERSEAVAALQAALSRLGYTNRDGRALRVDGDFGRETLLAVEAFQREQGLAADGNVGPQTQRAIQAATHAAREEAAVLGEAHAPLQTFGDPEHPQHSLYMKLRGLFPTGTSEARLAQATAVCHKAGIEKPEDLGDIYGFGSTVSFMPNSLVARMAQMDVGKPAPAVQQSVQQVQQFDQQQPMQPQPGQMQEQTSQRGPAPHG